MATAKNPIRRCAVYTRKSSEEGLDQDFNSLHAQREACEAYIKSQAGGGWKTVPGSYDDGGYSGGSLERPALDQLLNDVKAGTIDTVVVYKVDRLTRSLADFAKIVEIFDTNDVSFVSVTQQFNTTTSMGRLTLNMLLSFAQFEREVTGERIRDKIAASKAKGMWMGGFVPLGYEPNGRTLAINPVEAETVRAVFGLYLQLGNVRLVKDEGDRLGLRTKIRKKANGRNEGGCRLSRGYIYKLLNNPIYVGRIRHGDQTYDGQHEAIIDVETWDAVQAKLRMSAKGRDVTKRRTDPSPLAGKLFDASGRRLTPSHANKKGRRYRYYVSHHLISGTAESADDAGDGWRLPAHEIERRVAEATAGFLVDPSKIASLARNASFPAEEIPSMLDAVKRWKGDPLQLAARVELNADSLIIDIDLEPITGRSTPRLPVAKPMRIKRRGVEMRLVIEAGNGARTQDPILIKTIARGLDWFDALVTGRARSISAIAAAESLSDRYVGHMLQMAFLAPDIVQSILDGTQPADLTAADLIKRTELPICWDAQKALLGFD